MIVQLKKIITQPFNDANIQSTINDHDVYVQSLNNGEDAGLNFVGRYKLLASVHAWNLHDFLKHLKVITYP